MDIKLIDFQKHGDNRGMLVVAEYEKEIPFIVKSISYIYGKDKNSINEPNNDPPSSHIYITISGTCTITLTDNIKKDIIRLNNPTCGLYIGQDTRCEKLELSSDATLLILSSN